MRRKTLSIILFLLLISFFSANIAFGFDQGDVDIHGFVSQGYLRSSDNNYLGNSKDGSFEFNEIGISFSALLTDDLRFGAQLISKDLGEYGNNDLAVDWASLDYSLKDWLGFRAGKIKTPYGLYNRKRDVDILRTSVLMPHGVYNEGLRDLGLCFYGASIYGGVNLNTLGFFDYEFYGGTLDIPSGGPFLITYISFMEHSNPPLYSLVDIATGGNWSGLKFVFDHAEGGALTWSTPLSGLRFSASDAVGKGSLDGMEINLADFGLGTDVLPVSADVNFNHAAVFSAEYELSDFTFTAEYTRWEISFDLSVPAAYRPLMTALGITSLEPVKLEAYYGSISWDAFKWMTVGVAYGEYYPNADEKDGDDIKDSIPDYWAWQKDTSLSVRFNLSEYICVKMETHFYDGLGLASLETNPADESERNWILYAMKTSLNF